MQLQSEDFRPVEKCQVCGSTEFELAYVNKRDVFSLGLIVKNYVCKYCTAVFQNPLILRDNHDHFANDPTDFSPIYYTIPNKRTSYILKYSKDKGSFLDIGCGVGYMVKTFKDKGFDAQGLDPDKEFVEIGRKQGLDIIENDLEHFKTKKKYDIVCMVAVLNHIPDQLQFLIKTRNLLKDDGIFLLETPDANDAEGRIKVLFGSPHPLNYTERSIKVMLNNIGFDVLDIAEGGINKRLRVIARKALPKKVTYKDIGYGNYKSVIKNIKRVHIKHTYFDFSGVKNFFINALFAIFGKKNIQSLVYKLKSKT